MVSFQRQMLWSMSSHGKPEKPFPVVAEMINYSPFKLRHRTTLKLLSVLLDSAIASVMKLAVIKWR
jgi:hypothetical protein